MTPKSIADAIVDAINAGLFSVQFTAERAWVPIFDLEELTTLRVSVVPQNESIEQSERGMSFFDFTVGIGVQKKISTNEDVDILDTLAEEIVAFLLANSIEGMKRITVERDPIVSPDHFNQYGCFFSIIAATYRVQQ